ncbi:bifunctional adenosylcobinamide kinase/adenosylcobinamide-phosphate guanylyltransferase [Ornithinimicrobium murale]|uniref:bifunctional adenosylcobinamide kinase/adenosylcobinamide-phosphate guanylyltransferase n=1 Tax=Ornithinimicrobium murale TaxID=1050153 RepID=UPI000E0D0C45|nr:bifunctional adenosylcobinamide kinase/adenosylcobinamide-phosphate guanylyltransferase [Ornithinimicrobium murale]
MTTSLVLGAARNGKSAYAVSLLSGHDRVTYLATGRGLPDAVDPVWLERVEKSRAIRPEDWKTIETTALSQALIFSRHPVIIDTLSHWLWRVLDEHDLWDAPARAIETIDPLLDELLVAFTSLPHDVVAISDEVGWGLPATTDQERTHHEVLSHVNHRFSAVSDRVHLLVGGRVVDLSATPSLLRATTPF